MEELQKTLIKFLTEYGFQIIGGILILTVGAIVARWAGRVAEQWLSKKYIEPPLRMLGVRLLRLLIFAMAAVLALEKCGVPVTPMIAGIGVVGVGVGLALQGVFSNIAAGLVIIFTRPFRVGEYIELIGVHGQVTAIELLSSTLLHPDRSRVVIPNRKILGEILHNYGTMRQLDLSVRIAYGSNIETTVALVRNILEQNQRVMKDPAPYVGVTSLDDSSIIIAIKPWVAVNDYAAAIAEINQAVLEQFELRQIEIPYPQREIRIINGGASTPDNLLAQTAGERPRLKAEG